MALGLGAPEIGLIVLVVVLLFGAKKLPELARGSGRALRIFKAETKGLMDDEDGDQKTEAQRQIDQQGSTGQQQSNTGQPVDPSQQHRPEADR
jgi:sec-independent protein translocase protein TatA